MIGDVSGGLGSYRDGFELYRRACSADKTLQVIKGKSHYDVYDQPVATAEALAQIVPFFIWHLMA